MESFSKRQFIILILLAVVVIGLVLLFAFGGKPVLPTEPTKLTVWGTFDESVIWKELAGKYAHIEPRVRVEYRKLTFDEYENLLLSSLALDQGPDILYIHNTWLPKLKQYLTPLPDDIALERGVTTRVLEDSFVEVVLKDFVYQGKLWAAPLYVDTLALYWNRDLFNAAGIPTPPQTWDEFIEDVKKLTKLDAHGNIVQAGAAIGTAKNVNRSTDIVSLLMLQNGAEMTDPRTGVTKLDPSAVQFYIDFSNKRKPYYTWSPEEPYSIDAFYGGEPTKAAMMLNYSHHIETIKAKAAHLNFDVSPVPQRKDRLRDVAYANYFGLAVTEKSKNRKVAWEFLLWAASKEGEQAYLALTKRPVARRDLFDWQKNDPGLGIFAQQSLTATSWYQRDSTAIDRIFAEMVESVVSGKENLGVAVRQAETQVRALSP